MAQAFNLILASLFSIFFFLMGFAYNEPPVRKTAYFQQGQTQMIKCFQYAAQRGLIGQPALQRRCGRGDGDNPKASQAVDPAFGHDTFHSDSVKRRLIQDRRPDVTRKVSGIVHKDENNCRGDNSRVSVFVELKMLSPTVLFSKEMSGNY
jgi:hypothetical protein